MREVMYWDVKLEVRNSWPQSKDVVEPKNRERQAFPFLGGGH
jgi:hypothetical protein